MTDPYDASGAMSSLLARKAQAVEAKRVEKIQKMEPDTYARDYQEMGSPEFANKYGIEAQAKRHVDRFDAYEDEQYRQAGRSIDEKIMDAVHTVPAAAATMAAGVGALAFNKPIGVGDAKLDLRPVRDALLKESRAFQVRQFKKTTRALQADEAHRLAETNNDVIDEAAQKEAWIAAGMPEASAEVLGEMNSAKNAVGTWLKHPTALSSAVVDQLPSTLIGPAGKALVFEKAIAERAVGIMAKKGLGESAAKAMATKELTGRNMVIGTGLTEGSSALGDTVGSINETDYQSLAQQFPDRANELLSDDPAVAAKAKSDIATSAGNTAFGMNAVLSAASSKISERFNVDPAGTDRLTGPISRKIGTRAGEYLGDLGRETLEEGLQSASGQISSNVGKILAGDEETGVIEGVGAQVGSGALMGGLMAGTMGAPSTALGTAGEVGVVVKDFVNTNLDSISKPTKELLAKASSAISETTQKVAEHIATKTQNSPLNTPAAQDPILDPVSQEAMGLVTPEGVSPISRAAALGNALNALDSGEVTDQQQKSAIALFALKTSRELRTKVSEFEQEAANTQDPEAKKELLAQSREIETLLANDQILSLEQQVKDMPAEAVGAMFDQVIGLMDNAKLIEDPAVRQSYEMAKEVILQNPTLVPKTMAEALYSKLGDDAEVTQEMGFTPAHVEAVKAAVTYHKLTDDIAKNNSWIKGKDSATVTDEIKEKGFTNEYGYKNSLRDYFSDVAGAVANGDLGTAQQVMTQLRGFASHMQQKAKAFDEGAQKQLANTESQEKVEVSFKTKREEKLFANIHNEGGRNLIDTIHADADAVASTFNSLAQLYKIPGNFKPLPLMGKPKWRKGGSTQTEAAPAPVVEPVTETVSDVVITEAPALAPEKPNDLVARMETTAAGMSDSALNDRINKLMDKSDKTKTDEISLKVLNDEMTKREDAAVAEQAEENTAPIEDTKPEPVEAEAPTKTVVELRAEADAINGDEASVDFENDAPVAASELQASLDMPRGEYYRAVNPKLKTTAPTDDAAIAAELDDMEAPSDAKVIGKIGDTLTMKAAGNYLYAVNEDGDVKGLLINTAEGSTFMVHPENRGEGIGKALMRELLIRNPMAQSNGMSKGAIAVRDAVRQELRNGTSKPKDGSIQNIFAGLRDKVGEGLAGLNQFYRGFKPRKESQSLFHRYDNPLQEFKKAFEDVARGDDTALNNMFPEGERDRSWQGDQLSGLGQLTVTLAPEVVQSLNELLHINLDEKGIAGRFDKDAVKEWSHTNRKTLHVLTTDDQGNAIYHPKIAQAMALSALNWLTHNLGNPNQFSDEVNDMKKMFPDGVPAELAEASKTKFFYTQMVRQIAADLGNVLGVAPSDEASRSTTDGMLKQLALEAVFALEDVGLLTIQPIAVPGIRETFNMIGINNSKEDNDFTKHLPRTIVPIVERLGAGSYVSKLLNPGSNTQPSVGKKIKAVSQRIRGSGNPTSAIQKQNLQQMQDVPFTINGTVNKLSNQLGDRWKTLTGYTLGLSEENTNKVHFDTLHGVNQGIDYAHRAMADYYQQAEAHAKSVAGKVTDVPFHFSADVISNGRIMYNGASAQSSKYLRELLTPNKTTLDMGNKEHTDGFKITVAQAMGIKTERATWDGVIKELNALFTAPVFTQLFEDLVELNALDDAAPSNDLADRVFNAMQEIGIDTDRGIHALQAYALFNKAMAEGEATFDTALAFELDGVTDGPINALVHMGLWTMNPATVRQLRQGGLIIGRSDIESMNSMGTSIGDLYQNAADGLLKKLPIVMKTQPLWKQRKTSAAINLLERIQYSKITTDKNNAQGFSFTRKMPKHGVMATSYGSGMRSIVTQMSDEVVAQLYKEISDSLVAGQKIDPNLQAMIEEVMGKIPQLNDVEKYQSFRFNETQLKRLTMTLFGSKDEPGIGAILVEDIQDQMGQVLTSFDLLYKASGMQAAYLQKVFEKAYQERHAKLVAKGKLLKNEALSQKEEQALLNKFVAERPILKTMIASGQGEGVNVGQKDFNGKLWLGRFKKVRSKDEAGEDVENSVRENETVTSLNGRLPMDINVTRFSNPGVRAAALFNIALGDASMMSQMFMENALNMLNVYDGLEVSVTDILKRGNQVNKAVWTGWQYDALGAASESILDSNIDFSVFNEDELRALYKTLRLKKVAVEGAVYLPSGELETLVPTFNELLEDVRAELKTASMKSRAMKRAIAEHHNLTDHMAGSMNGFVNQGIDFSDRFTGDNDAEVDKLIAASIMERANRYIEKELETGKAVDNVITETVVEPEEMAVAPVATLTGENIKAFVQGLEADKMTRFILDKLMAVLPSDLTVLHGEASQVNAALARDGYLNVVLDDKDTRGVTIGNKVYLSSNKADVTAHELLHAVSYGLVREFYQGKKNNLTRAQQKAVKDLETLARDFMKVNPNANFDDARTRLTSFQKIINDHFAAGDTAVAVNEFMAYILTDKTLRDIASKHEAPGLLVRTTKKLIAVIRELIGLPNNVSVASFLEATVGRTESLLKNSQDQITMSPMQLFHALGEDDHEVSSDHRGHVAGVVQTLERVLHTLPVADMSAEQAMQSVIATAAAEMALDKFIQTGFDFTEQERYAFKMVQQMLYGYMELNPLTMSSMQELFTAVSSELKWQDFLPNPAEENPNQQDISLAMDMHNAISGLTYTDAKGRTSQMANFMALMLIYEPMQKKLSSLTPPKTEINKQSFDGLLKSTFQKMMDKLADVSQHVSTNMNQQQVLNTLLDRLANTQEATTARLKKAKNPWFSKAEGYAQQARVAAVDYLGTTETNARNGEDTPLNKWLEGLSGMGQAALDDDRANAFGSAIISKLNTIPLPESMMKLASEIVGTTDESADIDRHHSTSKQDVSKVRQQLRKEGPTLIRGLFSKELTKVQAKAMSRVMGNTDLQTLLGSFNSTQLQRLMNDPAYLDQAIGHWESKLAGKPNEGHWISASKHLAKYMVHKVNDANFLSRNAYAIAALSTNGHKQDEDTIVAASHVIDRLVTLYALRESSNDDKAVIGELLDSERKGMQHTLHLLRSLIENEKGKPNQQAQRFNMWKGALPVEMDSRTDIILADAKRGEQLLKQGYYLVKPYIGDDSELFGGMAYYATAEDGENARYAAGGRATYTQGAMQTVQATVSGVDRLSGQTVDTSVQTMVTNEKKVHSLTQLKAKYGSSTNGMNLLPVRNSKGAIVAYERPLDQAMLKKHLNIKEDLAESLGIWMGRQAEEALAAQANAHFIDVLHKNWTDAVLAGRTDEFIAVDTASDAIGKDRWGSVPKEIQIQLKEKFGGHVMIRKTNVDNALGYRQASIADIFTGNTNLPKPITDLMYKSAVAFFGKDAYKTLVNSERVWMGLIGAAKDWIVVRSGTVATANAMANQFQMLQSGVAPQRMLQAQAVKIKETLQYFKNEARQAQLTVLVQSEPDKHKRDALRRESEQLTDANKRLSIWDLVAAGELQTIAEGLSEQDQYNLLADFENYIKGKVEKLPDAMQTVAKYAVVAEDTALYKSLNRMIQLGDFIAKSVVYDDLITKGVDPDKAMREVSETFVNYTRNAGRGRDALERLGVTWFLNYKLRIQKIVLRNIRKNPIAFLSGGLAAEALGSDSLLSSSGPNTRWGSAFGLGQFFRAHKMNFWREMF